jgi:hypothetical protein
MYWRLGPKIRQWKHDKFWSKPIYRQRKNPLMSVFAYLHTHTHVEWLGSADDKHAKNMLSKSHESRITKQKRPPWAVQSMREYSPVCNIINWIIKKCWGCWPESLWTPCSGKDMLHMTRVFYFTYFSRSQRANIEKWYSGVMFHHLLNQDIQNLHILAVAMLKFVFESI